MSEKKERIVFDVAYQPQVRTNTDTRRIMLDVIIALLPAVVVGVINYGIAILLPIATSVASAVFFEWAYRKFMKKPDTIGDLTAVLTGLLMAMTMPPQTPWWMPIVGTFFAIVVVKQLYGGLGKNFLNPALAGRAFLMASYAAIMGAVVVDGVTTATPLSYMYAGEANPYTVGQMFLGTIPGAMGEASALALLAGGLYLIWKKVISWRIPVASSALLLFSPSSVATPATAMLTGCSRTSSQAACSSVPSSWLPTMPPALLLSTASCSTV